MPLVASPQALPRPSCQGQGLLSWPGCGKSSRKPTAPSSSGRSPGSRLSRYWAPTPTRLPRASRHPARAHLQAGAGAGGQQKLSCIPSFLLWKHLPCQSGPWGGWCPRPGIPTVSYLVWSHSTTGLSPEALTSQGSRSKVLDSEMAPLSICGIPDLPSAPLLHWAQPPSLPTEGLPQALTSLFSAGSARLLPPQQALQPQVAHAGSQRGACRGHGGRGPS